MVRLLVIIGSGEMTPGMRRVHREVLAQLAGPSGNVGGLAGVTVDTPYGFQPNADMITARTVDYFARLGLAMEVASLRRGDVGPLAREKALAQVAAADFVFSGPGSPTYALRQWRATSMPDLLAATLTTGGALVVASAAALTLGRVTLPVYEIYKSGADPYWEQGLDVLSRVGLNVAVIPHWNNREGGDHDTRYCFLGEERLGLMERQLPAGTAIVGVDEHTALVVDLEQGRAHVRGRGAVTIRDDGRETQFVAGQSFAASELQGTRGHARESRRKAVSARPTASGTDDERQALARRVLELEEGVARLGARADIADGAIDALLELRTQARDAGDWALADQIRDRLQALGMTVADTAVGTTAHRLPESPRRT